MLQGCQGASSMQGVATASGGACFDKKCDNRNPAGAISRSYYTFPLRASLSHCTCRNGERQTGSRVPCAGVFSSPVVVRNATPSRNFAWNTAGEVTARVILGFRLGCDLRHLPERPLRGTGIAYRRV